LHLGQALSESAAVLPKGSDPHRVHLGSGVAAMGERRDPVLALLLLDGSRYVGIGVGRRWNRSFMKSAAERTGGHFTQINPDEPIAWRAFDLYSTLNTPRLHNVRVDGADFLVMNQSISQGEEICAVARIASKE